MALPEPITRIEYYLASLAGLDVSLPEPVSRIEHFFAAWAGMDVEPPEPVTRIEWYLDKLAKVEPPEPEPELPESYKRLVGLSYSAGTYYLIEGFHLRGDDTVHISFSVDKACNVFGCYTTTSAQDNFSLYMSTAASAKYLRYDGETYNSYIASANFGRRYDVDISPEGTEGMPNDSVITPAEFTASADLCIGTTSTGATSSKLDGNIWGNFTVGERLKLIPCERVSDGVLGYFDAVGRMFYEPVGSAPTSLGYDEE